MEIMKTTNPVKVCMILETIKNVQKILYFQIGRSFSGGHKGLECIIKGLRCSGSCVE